LSGERRLLIVQLAERKLRKTWPSIHDPFRLSVSFKPWCHAGAVGRKICLAALSGQPTLLPGNAPC
jgi:hypothetical protein